MTSPKCMPKGRALRTSRARVNENARPHGSDATLRPCTVQVPARSDSTSPLAPTGATMAGGVTTPVLTHVLQRMALALLARKPSAVLKTVSCADVLQLFPTYAKPRQAGSDVQRRLAAAIV